MPWSPEGTRFQYRPFALGEGDGFYVCKVCERMVDADGARGATCPHCGVRFRITNAEREAFRRNRAIDVHEAALRALLRVQQQK